MAIDCAGVWVIRTVGLAITAATPKIAVQYVASAGNTAEVLYYTVNQSASSVSAMEQIQLVRLSAAATVTAAVSGTNAGTLLDYSAGGAAAFKGLVSTAGTGINASSAGTQTDIINLHNFNILAGYEWQAQPNMRIFVPASGKIALEIQAVNSGTWTASLVIRET